MKFAPAGPTQAARPGNDPAQVRARRAVATDFYNQHVYMVDVDDWNVIRRALQCIDFELPVVIGPAPSAPRELVALPESDFLGKGYFQEGPPHGATARPAWWVIAPNAPYLKWFIPRPARDPDAPPQARYLVARARRGPSPLAKPK